MAKASQWLCRKYQSVNRAPGNYTLEIRFLIWGNNDSPDQCPNTIWDGNNGNGYTMTFTVVEVGFPVTIRDFNIKREEKSALLSWSTLSEIYTSHFEIEKSADGSKFEPIGKVAAAAAIHDRQNYSFTDVKPFRGRNFYRIRIIDLDGGYSYSSSESIFIPFGGREFGIYPVMASERLILEFGKPAENGMIAIYDIHGQMIISVTLEKGINRLEIDINDLKKGSFVIRYTDGAYIGNRMFFRI